MTPRARKALLLATFVGLAWGATATFGRAAVRSELLPSVRAVARQGSHTEPPEVPPGERVPQDMHFYWVQATAYAPFILRVDRGAMCGGLCGEGARAWYLWLPGFTRAISAFPVWET